MGYETYHPILGHRQLTLLRTMHSTFSTTLPGRARDRLRAVIAHVLAEESQLAAATHGYSWRVRGSAVQSLNRLFTEQGRQIERWLGKLAAQARAIGLAAPSTGRAHSSASAIEARPVDAASPSAALAELLTLHEHIAARLRADRNALEERAESLVAGLLSDLIDFHDTTAWMLKLLLASPEPVRVR